MGSIIVNVMELLVLLQLTHTAMRYSPKMFRQIAQCEASTQIANSFENVLCKVQV